jgi:hypothetical protein
LAINDKSYILALLHGNMTFYLTSIKPFYKLHELIKAKPERIIQDNVKEDIIIINTLPVTSLKRNKGRPRKYLNVFIFLQDNV